MKFMYFSIKYRCSDILLKKKSFIFNRQRHVFTRVIKVDPLCTTSPRNSAELAEAVPIVIAKDV